MAILAPESFSIFFSVLPRGPMSKPTLGDSYVLVTELERETEIGDFRFRQAQSIDGRNQSLLKHRMPA